MSSRDDPSDVYYKAHEINARARDWCIAVKSNSVAALIVGFVLLVVRLSCTGSPKLEPPDPTKSVFKPGQIWSYQGRAQDTKSRVQILKVEPVRAFLVVHVCIDGLTSKTDAMEQVGDSIPHLAILEDSLKDSVLSLESERPVAPTFAATYSAWKSEANGKKAMVCVTSLEHLLAPPHSNSQK